MTIQTFRVTIGCGTPKKFTAHWPRVSSIGLACCSPLPAMAMVLCLWRWYCVHGNGVVSMAMVFYPYELIILERDKTKSNLDK